MIPLENGVGQDAPTPRPRTRRNPRPQAKARRLTGVLISVVLSILPVKAADQLDGWPFTDTNWFSWSGYAPVAFSNLVNVTGGDWRCVELNSTNPAFLRY